MKFLPSHPFRASHFETVKAGGPSNSNASDRRATPDGHSSGHSSDTDNGASVVVVGHWISLWLTDPWRAGYNGLCLLDNAMVSRLARNNDFMVAIPWCESKSLDWSNVASALLPSQQNGADRHCAIRRYASLATDIPVSRVAFAQRPF